MLRGREVGDAGLGLAGETTVELAQPRPDLPHRGGGHDQQGQGGQEDQHGQRAPAGHEGGQWIRGEEADEAAGSPHRLETVPETGGSAREVGDPGARHGEPEQPDGDAVVGLGGLRVPEDPDGEAHAQDGEHEGHEPEGPAHHGVHPGSGHGHGGEVRPAQVPPLHRGDEHAQHEPHEGPAVTALLGGDVGAQGPHPAHRGSHHVPGTGPGPDHPAKRGGAGRGPRGRGACRGLLAVAGGTRGGLGPGRGLRRARGGSS